MTSHTPELKQEELFQEVLAKHISCALRLYNKQESIEPDVFHRENLDVCNRLALAWIDCKCETIESLGRALCYAFYNFPFDPSRFNEEYELYYRTTTNRGHCFKDYWDGIAKYVKKSLDGLI